MEIGIELVISHGVKFGKRLVNEPWSCSMLQSSRSSSSYPHQ